MIGDILNDFFLFRTFLAYTRHRCIFLYFEMYNMNSYYVDDKFIVVIGKR